MEKDLVDLSLDDKEDEILQVQGQMGSVDVDTKFCLIQIHEVSLRFHNEALARQLGDFLGKFVEYDNASLRRGFRN
ncbi:hypothetical protein J1N35_001948 [Gossypium stocksii]|uniref:Uncharacterized protein n=1 Tax=Gossypium stocksii TaxID=47602 RepID=A0A9D3WJN4_9ROSI|nr:hypothetical protein J1N35_001948 [Gossypium stocksii]